MRNCGLHKKNIHRYQILGSCLIFSKVTTVKLLGHGNKNFTVQNTCLWWSLSLAHTVLVNTNPSPPFTLDITGFQTQGCNTFVCPNLSPNDYWLPFEEMYWRTSLSAVFLSAILPILVGNIGLKCQISS